MNKQTIIIIGLAALIVLALGYIGYDKYEETQQQEKLNIQQAGIQAGYQQAVVQLLQQASTCNPVPVRANNVTLNLVAVECLQQGNA